VKRREFIAGLGGAAAWPVGGAGGASGGAGHWFPHSRLTRLLAFSAYRPTLASMQLAFQYSPPD
jgi:hypothetical protein